MAGMTLWDDKKGDDYRFIDDQIREMFRIGGVGCLLHKYLGVIDQGEQGDATQPSTAKSKKKALRQIQDLFFLENRDRAYDPHVYELKAAYNMQDSEFSIMQFGMFDSQDTLYVEFHMNDVLDKVGRKLMSGDVLEFPHLREDTLLDDDMPAVNKYYVIQDVNRAATGWSQVWRPHIWRVKMKPLTNSQEYKQILDAEVDDSGMDLRSLISDLPFNMNINDAIVEQAEHDVPMRNFQTQHFYVVPGDEAGKQDPWIFAGDGVPPNGAKLANTGTSFPDEPKNHEWFLHTGMEPHVLYQYAGAAVDKFGQAVGTGGVWERREVDYRKKWSAAHRILQSFVNNDNVNKINSEEVKEKTMLSKAIKPRADF